MDVCDAHFSTWLARARDQSLRARLRAALDDNQRQRELIASRREELAIAHGGVRELELDHRMRHA